MHICPFFLKIMSGLKDRNYGLYTLLQAFTMGRQLNSAAGLGFSLF